MPTITPAAMSDAEQLARLGRATFAETFGDLFAGHTGDLASYLDATFAPAKIASSLARPGNRYWTARQDGAAIGYAKLKLGSAHPGVCGQRVAQLQKIYVLRAHLGTGAGQQLLDAVWAGARAAQCERLWLTVLESNARAIGFYLRNGWTRCAKDTHRIGAQEFVYDVLTAPV